MLDSGSEAGMTEGEGEKMGSRIREDRRGGITPIPSTSSGQALAFPPQEGREWITRLDSF